MSYQTMNRQRKFILVAAALGIIAVFLPWIKMDVGGFLGGLGVDNSLNGFRGIGVLVFISFLVAGILAFIGEQHQALERTSWLIALCAGVVALIGIIAYLVGAKNNMSLGFGLVEASIGIGAWLSFLAALGVILGAWLFKNKAHSIRESFDHVKKNLTTVINSTAGNAAPKSGRMDELERLIDLKSQGKITEEEYQQMKSKIL